MPVPAVKAAPEIHPPCIKVCLDQFLSLLSASMALVSKCERTSAMVFKGGDKSLGHT